LTAPQCTGTFIKDSSVQTNPRGGGKPAAGTGADDAMLQLRIAMLVATVACMAALPGAVVLAQTVKTIPVKYTEFDHSSPDFKRFWVKEAERDEVAPADGMRPTAYVTYVRSSSGALIAVTMLYAREECGPKLCPFKILRDGKVVAEFSACSNTDEHRIATDGRFLVICEFRVQIPTG
jgi:hypothetical protein